MTTILDRNITSMAGRVTLRLSAVQRRVGVESTRLRVLRDFWEGWEGREGIRSS